MKDVIIRGGENIAPTEVEGVLEAHPSVRQAVAVGIPDARLGEQVVAFVVVAPGAAFDLDECRRWFETQGVARFKTPERVEVVDEIPTLAAANPTGTRSADWSASRGWWRDAPGRGARCPRAPVRGPRRTRDRSPSRPGQRRLRT